MDKKKILNLPTDVNEIKNTKIPGLETDVNELKNTKIPELETNVNEMKNTKIPKLETDVNEMKNNTAPELQTISVVDGTATLTANKYQEVTLADGNSIVLPTVTKFTEIHLFFDTTSAMNITFPAGIAWQNGTVPVIEASKHYELIFTYRNNLWLGGYIEYIG